MPKIFILKTGAARPNITEKHGDMDQWIYQGLNSEQVEIRNVLMGDALPELSECAGAVISGSYHMVTENLDWSLQLEDWVRQAISREIPLLGICYGHQLIAKATGGDVGFHPDGVEIGTVQINKTEQANRDKLLARLPQTFSAHAIHYQSVQRLPPNSVRLAESSFEANHSFRIGRCAWGVQFHPEFNDDIMRMNVHNLKETLEQSGLNTHQLLENIQPTPTAASVLATFAELVFEQR